jgi:hypothetical protein
MQPIQNTKKERRKNLEKRDEIPIYMIPRGVFAIIEFIQRISKNCHEEYNEIK